MSPVSTTNISLTDNDFDSPYGTGAFASLPRHFVSGYYRAVPTGRKSLLGGTSFKVCGFAEKYCGAEVPIDT
jgi:hypothetical protein